ERLGALMMGRWPSGCPVDLSSVTDDATKGDENNFWFDKDPKGEKCPLGAHIRRTNPREGPDPDPQNLTPNDPALGSHRHRLIRRGMPYGPQLPAGEADDGKKRGLFFIALNASIARQFEFLQGFWVNSGEFQGLDRTDRDPIIGGNRDERAPNTNDPRKFTMPGTDKQFPWAFNLPEFVTTRGGDYFFVPSKTALNLLANATVAFPGFLDEYGMLEKQISDPGRLALARRDLVTKWLVERAKMMFDELRSNRPVFKMPGYLALGVPTIVIATKAADVREILEKNQVFTVKLYGAKMASPRGPFILGMPADGEQYKRELAILQKAVHWNTDQLAIAEIVGRITKEVLDKIRQTPGPPYQLDLIQEIAWRVPVRLCGEYFGVPGPDEATAKRWFRAIYMEMFLNLRNNPEWTRAGDTAVQEMNAYLDVLIERQIAAPAPGVDTVLARLVPLFRDPSTGQTDKEGIRRNLLGLTVGVVETTLKAIARTVDQFLRRPRELDEARQAVNNDDTFTRYVWEAMRFNPQNHVLFRVCEKPYSLRGVDIPPGSLVFAATLSAMFDFPDAEEFKIDRPSETYMFFGHDRHQCLGEHISKVQIREVLRQVLILKKLRRAKDDQYNPLDLLPKHFMLEFDA
ncbi:MAG: cytochrome P450, partial [Dehalococcoidia bacterium]|nr:cytochrome P450 [Dehalococcoidia bacterium]